MFSPFRSRRRRCRRGCFYTRPHSATKSFYTFIAARCVCVCPCVCISFILIVFVQFTYTSIEQKYISFSSRLRVSLLQVHIFLYLRHISVYFNYYNCDCAFVLCMSVCSGHVLFHFVCICIVVYIGIGMVDGTGSNNDTTTTTTKRDRSALFLIVFPSFPWHYLEPSRSLSTNRPYQF